MNDLLEKHPQSAGRNATEIAGLFAMGVQRHQRGDLAGAWQHYEAVLARDPAHAESLHHLGIIATQTGRHELAAELIGRAIQFNDRVPEFHYNIGIAFGSLGQFERAVAHNQKAVELKPDHAPAFMNLGKALLAQGRAGEAIGAYRGAVALAPNAVPVLLGLANALADGGLIDEAVAQYRSILALNPNDADTHNNLGTLLASQGQLAEAVASYRQALRLNPKLATAEFNLANALRDSGQPVEAVEHYRNAVRLKPDFADAHNNLGHMLARDADYAEACAAFQQAIAARPNFAAAHRNLGETARAAGDLALALEALGTALKLDNTPATHDLLHLAFADPRSVPHAAQHRDLLIELMTLPRDDLELVMPSAISVLESDPVCARCLAQTQSGAQSGATAFGLGDLQALANDRLLLAMLGQERICSVPLERFLTALRAALLETALQPNAGDIPGLAVLSLQCALARYCFQVEYVFAVSNRETGQLGALQADAAIAPSTLLALASYIPLHTLPQADALAQRPWPEPVETVIEQQIRVPREVARIAAAIPRLTPIDDAVSQRVARQYEENPFPRWTRLPPTAPGDITVSADLRARFPGVPLHLDDDPDGCDYLIAGCGTGKHAATIARHYRGVRVTAVDLSRASLGYAQYKTDSLGLAGISYGQADVMALERLGQTFDVIDSVGVLHHMASPEGGWRALIRLLRPKGCMRIALYSELARRNIVAARAMIAERGYGQSREDIRRCRQDILALAEDAPERQTAGLRDFYSLSDCRDLLFHVQEHRMTWPRIAQFLADHELELIGLEVNATAQEKYRARFAQDRPGETPNDTSKDTLMTDLNNWHVFEQENPDLFLNMYRFWVQRKLGAENRRADRTGVAP
jgi:tetratricopeptide (TPR) repeat protein/2-polyprenyl-3-methyl-5-hydroxy-6-metoxy-1,4-benzoquinol methylase